MLAVVSLHLVGLRLIFQSLFQYVLHVGDGSALAALCELQGDEGVEAHAAGAEEWQAVDDAVVEGLDVAGVDDVEGAFQFHGYTEVPGQSVARAAGHDGEGCLRVGEGPGHFVHRAVATDSHHHVDAFCRASLGYLCRMAGIFRQPEFIVELPEVECLLYQLRYFLLRVGARDGVQDEYDFLFFCHF